MHSNNFRLVMAQLNPLVGDISGNRDKIIASIQKARDAFEASCVVFSELVLTGYPPEDLLLRPSFIQDCEAALSDIAQQCQNIIAIVGAPYKKDGQLFNAAFVLRDQQRVDIAIKQQLPNYGVFDEMRYFTVGTEACVIELADGLKAGLTICEDIWYPQPAGKMKDMGAEFLINLNASPFHVEKRNERLQTLRDRINECGLPIIYVNQVGGQDELVFDGASMALDRHGVIAILAPTFGEGLFPVDVQKNKNGLIAIEGQVELESVSVEATLYQALVSGVRDYINKNRFSGAIIGLSGGIDSALTLAIAVDALGADKVTAVMMPSQYTADMSLQDAKDEAERLRVEYQVIPIAPAVNAFTQMLMPVFSGLPVDVTEENIQARCRGVALMAMSNKLGKMVLTTGNKSEMAVGYATLYGDMAGGFSPLKDVYKTMVYRLAEYRNSLGQVIPQRVITRPPSAELAPDQTDQDTLPAYNILDDILLRYLEQDQSASEIVAAGYAEEAVKDVIQRVDRNEYKRRQAPPGIKVTKRAFGRDRRYPITSLIGW